MLPLLSGIAVASSSDQQRLVSEHTIWQYGILMKHACQVKAIIAGNSKEPRCLPTTRFLLDCCSSQAPTLSAVHEPTCWLCRNTITKTGHCEGLQYPVLNSIPKRIRKRNEGAHRRIIVEAGALTEPAEIRNKNNRGR